MRYTPILTDGKFGDTEELETSDLNIELTNLKLGTRYKVEVVAVNQGGESDPAVRNYQVPALGGWCSCHLVFVLYISGLRLTLSVHRLC